MSAKIKLLGKNDPRSLDLHEDGEGFTTYGDAVRAGQRRYGHGCFMVDTGNRVPSLTEQLLRQKSDKIESRRKRLLETL